MSSTKSFSSRAFVAWFINLSALALMLIASYLSAVTPAFGQVIVGSGVQLQVTHSLQHAATANVVGLPTTLPNGLTVTRQASATGQARVNADLTVAPPPCTVDCTFQRVRFTGVQELSAGASYTGGPLSGPLRAEGATNAAMNVFIRIAPVTTATPPATAGN